MDILTQNVPVGSKKKVKKIIGETFCYQIKFNQSTVLLIESVKKRKEKYRGKYARNAG